MTGQLILTARYGTVPEVHIDCQENDGFENVPVENGIFGSHCKEKDLLVNCQRLEQSLQADVSLP